MNKDHLIAGAGGNRLSAKTLEYPPEDARTLLNFGDKSLRNHRALEKGDEAEGVLEEAVQVRPCAAVCLADALHKGKQRREVHNFIAMHLEERGDTKEVRPRRIDGTAGHGAARAQTTPAARGCTHLQKEVKIGLNKLVIPPALQPRGAKVQHVAKLFGLVEGAGAGKRG